MYVWIFNYLDKVTSNYHEGGGIVIIAENLREAKKLVEDHAHIEVPDWKKAIKYSTAGSAKPKLYVFPDAGCC